MRDTILKILRTGPRQTRVIQQILEYDYQDKYNVAQVRRRLKQMENEGIVISTKLSQNQMQWSIA